MAVVGSPRSSSTASHRLLFDASRLVASTTVLLILTAQPSWMKGVGKGLQDQRLVSHLSLLSICPPGVLAAAVLQDWAAISATQSPAC